LIRSPLSAPATRYADPPGTRAATTTRRCSSAGKNTISACAPSSKVGAFATAATSSFATRSARSDGSCGRDRAGSTSCATGCTSAASGGLGGCCCWRASVFYLLTGMRHGLVLQTLRALPAAIRVSSGMTVQRHSAAARAYLRANDTAHRGHWLTRPWREGPRVGDNHAGPAKRSCSSSGRMAGLSTR
jgi:hypothetical protein